MVRCPLRTLPLLLIAVWVPALHADAVVMSRAMQASTIAEVFVEEGAVRIELEIGAGDLAAFADLLPDELRGKMGLPAEPLAQRLPRFFAEGWTIRADDGPPLPGTVVSMEGRHRVIRDEITGEPLPNQPADAEAVVAAELIYAFEGHPASLALRPPGGPGAGTSAALGFVLYHGGLPVNDFRYLALEEVVDLDWDDPWYSRFRNRNLKRYYDAPLQVFLYVEPFEVRKEVVVRPVDMQRLVDLGLDGATTIRAEDWGRVKSGVVDHLIGRAPVVIDGREIEPVLDRVHFIERTLRTSRVLEEPEDLDLLSAVLGVIITYPVTGLPDEVSMAWDLFPERVERIPASPVDEAGGLPTFLSPDDHVLRWRNVLTNPTRAKLVELDPPPGPDPVSLPVASLACAAAALVCALVLRGRNAGRLGAAGLLAVAAATWPVARVPVVPPFAKAATLSEDQSSQVCGDLLRNVYRAFDFREEGDIYDVLAKSTDGDLLTDVYLETRRALTLENQGGARARVQEVEVTSTDSTRIGDGPGFTSRCTWEVTGSVGHWGHLHQRRNRYDAELTVVPVDGQWRIAGLELLDEVRL
jgi:hypothetical protein